MRMEQSSRRRKLFASNANNRFPNQRRKAVSDISQGKLAPLESFLALELARATESAAIAAGRWRGRGDEMAADRAAVEAMRAELVGLPLRGRVMIGQGEHGATPLLHVGDEVGFAKSNGAKACVSVDLALAALEGSTLCAKDMPGAISVLAMAKKGSLLCVPDVYMDKIAIGPGYAQGLVDLDRDPADNIEALAAAKGVTTGEVTVCILDRPRHAELIAKCRRVGASVRLISDGDVAGVILTTQPAETGVDMYIGRGGAPEGVLAAGVLHCVGGQMQARLVLDTHDKIKLALAMRIVDPKRKYDTSDLAADDIIVSMTGVTTGPLLSGTTFTAGVAETETLIYNSRAKSVRRIRTRHY